MIIGVLVASFVIGTITHTLHLVTVEWVELDDVSAWMNIYRATLTILGPLAVGLLLYRGFGP